MNFAEIEKRLRTSPQPKPPAGLKQKLTAQINLHPANAETVSALPGRGIIGWLRHWWPALAPAGVSLACALVMVSQQLEARGLRRTNQTLEKRIAEARAIVAPPGSALQAGDKAASAAMAEQQEIARLQERAAQLSNSVARLEALRAENEALSKQPASVSGLTEEELAALAKAREQAMSAACINNLKQIGLSVRVWAQDSDNLCPPNFLSMSNELATPKILVCPAETNRAVARSFVDLSDANCSYELLATSGSALEPNRVATRCPIHGHIGLCDGSVHSQIAKQHPDWLVEKDGMLFLIPFSLQVKPHSPRSP